MGRATKNNPSTEMEKAKITQMNKQLLSQYSNIYSQLESSLDQAVSNPESLSIYFNSMYESDETIGNGIELQALSVLRKLGKYTNKNKQIEEFVHSNIESMERTYSDALKELLIQKSVFGFSVGEMVLYAVESNWNLGGLVPYKSNSVTFVPGRLWNGTIGPVKIEQTLSGKKVRIPTYKAIIMRNGIPMYGQSRLKWCYRWWSFKRAALKMWAIWLEKYAMPTVVGKSSNTGAMFDTLNEIFSKALVVVGQDDDVTFNESKGNISNYENTLSFINKMMYRALFLPSLLEAGEGGGSYALGEVHFAMFDDACLSLAEDLADQVLEQVWKPIIFWNFGPQEDYGYFPIVKSRSVEELEGMSRAFLNMFNMGAMDEEDYEFMRRTFNTPNHPNVEELKANGKIKKEKDYINPAGDNDKTSQGTSKKKEDEKYGNEES